MLEISKGARVALDILHAHGYEAYLVGGCVRDMVMGVRAHDYDITTSATPNQMKASFLGQRIIETGIKHGTLTFVYEKEPIEITTYRIEGEYKDNRHPESVVFTTELRSDLCRRDFTMNALVYNEREGIIDLFGGLDDIKSKLVRAVGEPEKRFTEDALRILRGMRFASTLGFEIEEKTRAAMIKCAPLLKSISGERINCELSKLLVGKNVGGVLRSCREVFEVILPVIKQMNGFLQHTKYHIYDVWEHTVRTVENIEPKAHLRLTMLLHDTGKPSKFTMDAHGVGHFYGHGNVSCEIAKEFLDKYKYDNFTKARVLELIKIHDTPIEPDRVLIKKRINRLGKDTFFELLRVKRADDLAKSPEYKTTGTLDKIEDIANEIIKEECFTLASLKISGYDLILLGFMGREIGKALDLLLNEVIEEKIENEKDTLIKRAKELLGEEQ